MNGQTVARVLDKVITTVAEREFNRLTRDLNNVQVLAKISKALCSLRRLQAGNIPDYDEWDALFYHWYQPSHINLAYSTIEWANELSDQLHIVDFGCGALAMQFGVVLAAANAIEREQAITKIKIDSIDTSQAMVNIGQKMWEQLKREIGKDPNLGYLGRAYEVIHPTYKVIPETIIKISDIEQVGFAQNSNFWISAIHTVYDDNKDIVQQSLKSLVDRLNPDVCFASTHSSRENLLSEVWPFADNTYYGICPNYVQTQFYGELEKITQWRRRLNSKLPKIHNYLNNAVTWKWRPSTIWIYTRREHYGCKF